MPPKSRKKPTFKEKSNPIPSYLNMSVKSRTSIENSKKPGTFNLFKLPWDALKEVLKPMDHRDVFVLSLSGNYSVLTMSTHQSTPFNELSTTIFAIYSVLNTLI
ncbi:hypothetical protein CAEBREN_22628 [Caenorhabditis brenneri]|uniref:F-box domain-containing protein n=1 Tax=Caenorhabditis brenneri TaxID=135651 RepID=G0NZN6_CAEBE|nr:hypothetical protein CAEBREN_22628 [Caenorhabditis brenneri]